MVNHDILIKKLFWNYNKNIANRNYRFFNHNLNKYKNIKEYLQLRYDDSESIHESLIRIIYNIEKRPVCDCGNPVRFIGKPNSKGIFSKSCSHSCSSKNKATIIKREQTCIKKYNNKTYNNIQKSKQTRLERYGDENYNNRASAIQTNILRYGGPAPICDENIKQKIKEHTYIDYSNINIDYNKVFEHVYKTKLERYGDQYYNNNKKAEKTNIKKYGYKTPLQNENIKEKIKQTNLNKYGVDNPAKSQEIKEKIKQTNLNRYGVTYLSKLDSIKEKIYNTKRKNNTFNTSKPEKESLKLLTDKYGKSNVVHNYKCDKYPFFCDAYIKSKDIFIEFNYHWTHGMHFYDPNNIEDKNKLKEWESKNTEFYNKAIEVWTIRDVNKLNTAKKNKLNYFVFYKINDFINWLKE